MVLERLPDPPDPPRPGAVPVWRRVLSLLAACVCRRRANAAPGDSHISLIAAGYSQAMYRLGRRYERGAGARRNRGEASRCYSKAAKLGSAQALDRIIPVRVPPTPVESLPAAPAADPETNPPPGGPTAEAS